MGSYYSDNFPFLQPSQFGVINEDILVFAKNDGLYSVNLFDNSINKIYDLSLESCPNYFLRINEDHIFISVIAYAILHSIRFELKKHKISHSWNELKDILSTHQRATIKLKDKNNSVNYIRVSSEPNADQFEIYNCLDINFKLNRKIKKVKFSL